MIRPSSSTITLPWPPTVNTYWRSIVIDGSVRVLISKRGRSYRLDAQAAVLQQFGVLRPTRARLLVAIVAYPPDRRSRDLDNLCKPVLDALTHSRVWEDDSQIDGLFVLRGAVVDGGRLEVHIDRVSGEPARQQLIDLAGKKVPCLTNS